MKKIIFAALAAALGTLAVQAQAQVVFNAPMEFAGTGCTPGSYSFAGEGTDTLTVMFSAYDAASPAANAASGLERAACSFAVPVQVPQGYQVSVMTADWRGYADGATELFREYFFAGQEGITRISNPSGNYTESDEDLAHETSSMCGENVTLRINSAVRALASDSYIAVDTLDLQNTVELHLKWSKCAPRVLPAVLDMLL